jgi:hypothetical protein
VKRRSRRRKREEERERERLRRRCICKETRKLPVNCSPPDLSFQRKKSGPRVTGSLVADSVLRQGKGSAINRTGDFEVWLKSLIRIGWFVR